MSKGRRKMPINTKKYVMSGMTQDECIKYITAEQGQKLYLNIQAVKGRGVRLVKADITGADLYSYQGNRCYKLYREHSLKLIRAYSCEGKYKPGWTSRSMAIRLESKFHDFISDKIDAYPVGNTTDYYYAKISAKRYAELGDEFWETIGRPFMEERLVK